MIMKKQTTVSLLFLFLSMGNLLAQINAVSNYRDFISSFYVNNERIMFDTLKKSGYYKEFERMNRIWTPRLYPHWNANIAANAMFNYVQSFNNRSVSTNQNTYDASWNSVGPDVSTNSVSNFTGQMHRITFDPQYNINGNQTIYAASSFGGLWRSENGGNNWANVNTDVQIPYCGVADVAVNYTNTDIIYIGTGYADAPIINGYNANQTTINPIQTQGVYRSLDRGVT